MRRRLFVLLTALATVAGVAGPVAAAENSSLPVVTATAAPGQVTASWTRSLYPDGTEVDGYTVAVLGNDGYSETLRTPSSRAATLTFDDLPADVYRVLVQPGQEAPAGPTGFSDHVDVPWLPGPPTAVQATASNAGVSVRWQAPASDGRRTISAYVVTPRTAQGDQPGRTVDGAARSAQFTGLTPGESYTFTVSARNSIGQGLASVPSPAVVVQSELVLELRVPVGRTGLDYHGRAVATLGVAPYRFVVTDGALPAGLTLDADSGAITGRPRGTGISSVTVTATDAVGTRRSTSGSIQVDGPVAAGDLLVTSFRQSGPAGAGDQFVELTNVSRQALPIAGVVLTSGSGASVILPDDAPVLAPAGRAIVAGRDYSAVIVPTVTAPDGIGTGGVQVRLPDASTTVTDTVGPGSGLHSGSGLPPVAGEPRSDFAWMRKRAAAGPSVTGDNATDFQLVSATGSGVGGRPAVRGTVTPLPLAATSASSVSAQLLDPSVPASASPNREITTVGGQRFLTIRRLVTNAGNAPASGLALRISTMSTRNGAASPFSAVPIDSRAQLTIVQPVTPSSDVVLGSGEQVTVTILAPAGGGSGGLYAVMPIGTFENTLFPGQQTPVALTFAIDRPGSFWVTWDTLTGAA